jgi:DNA-binding Lrp family transcriptional regulator
MLSQLEKNIVRELQAGLPLVPRPFAEVASRLSITEAELLAKINEMHEKGYLRRIGAALRHHRVGFSANAMVVWRVPQDKLAETGRKLAESPEVTHCYQRKTYDIWPFNLYTMIHAQTREECLALAERLSQSVGAPDYQLLFSVKELKKSSMRYFVEN